MIIGLLVSHNFNLICFGKRGCRWGGGSLLPIMFSGVYTNCYTEKSFCYKIFCAQKVLVHNQITWLTKAFVTCITLKRLFTSGVQPNCLNKRSFSCIHQPYIAFFPYLIFDIFLIFYGFYCASGYLIPDCLGISLLIPNLRKYQWTDSVKPLAMHFPVGLVQTDLVSSDVL